MQTETDKYQLIHTIVQIENIWVLKKIAAFVQQIQEQNPSWNQIVKPLRKTTSLEELKLAQNYQKPLQTEVDDYIQKLAIEEPIEMLLAQLNK